MKILIAGLGYVGNEVFHLHPEAQTYDIIKTPPEKQAEILSQRWDYCMVCVSTPAKSDGSCDISAVEDVIAKINADVFVVRSTVPPKTTEYLALKYNKVVIFQPEYVASSSPYPSPLGDVKARSFIILGGKIEAVKKVRRLYETIYPPTTEIFETDSTTAEIIKYAENCYIATKVTFCNEFYNICQAFKVDWDVVKKGVFDLDPRMTTWWTNVYPENRGWDGHCLPKDVSAMIESAKAAGYLPHFLASVVNSNVAHKGADINEKVKFLRGAGFEYDAEGAMFVNKKRMVIMSPEWVAKNSLADVMNAANLHISRPNANNN